MVAEGGGSPRLRQANRQQLSWQTFDLDGLVGLRHVARTIWQFLDKLNLDGFYADIKAREGVAGRDATDPKILLTLWLYALSRGVASARELDRLCHEHDAYKWICGGVSVNYHMLSDFRVEQGGAVDQLLSQILATLVHKGLLKLHRIAQDGTRIRASAGAASLRKKTLDNCLTQARDHLKALDAEAANPDPQRSARVRSARQRAAREREQRIVQARAEYDQLAAAKATAKNHPQRKKEPRASTTDPQARVMKMPDGGFRPAYNLQFATDTETRLIVGVTATNAGTDNNQLEPMLDDMQRRTSKIPDQALLDGGYMNFAGVEQATARAVEVFAPLRVNKDYKIDPHQVQPHDSAAIAAYRQRMASEQGKLLYKQRAATAETINADTKTYRGLGRLLVRGLPKVLFAGLWSALTCSESSVRVGYEMHSAQSLRNVKPANLGGADTAPPRCSAK
jgi:transposase